MASDPAGAFVSSTCYDLLDLRSELEPWLRDLGFKPFLSDRPSDFEVDRNVNAIETCLINLRRCSVCICVLSARYGGILGGTFGNVSATHLECRTARVEGIPLYMYVRDRLRADHETWKKNRGIPIDYPWVREKDERPGLFGMISEHEGMVGPGTTNWLQTFRDSADLKSLIAHDLQRQSKSLLLQRHLAAKDEPVISLRLRGGLNRETSVVCTNIGGTTALDASIGFSGDAAKFLGDLAVGQVVETTLDSGRGSSGRALEVRYATRAGDSLIESFECLVVHVPNGPAGGTCRLVRRGLRFAEGQ
jgi:uncharacterized protein DUF4062